MSSFQQKLLAGAGGLAVVAVVCLMVYNFGVTAGQKEIRLELAEAQEQVRTWIKQYEFVLERRQGVDTIRVEASAKEKAEIRAKLDRLWTERVKSATDSIDVLRKKLEELAPTSRLLLTEAESPGIGVFEAQYAPLERDWAWIHDPAPMRIDSVFIEKTKTIVLEETSWETKGLWAAAGAAIVTVALAVTGAFGN